MAKYFANFYACGTHYQHDLEFTNKTKAIREIRETAEANRPGGTPCIWIVRDAEGRAVAVGGKTCKGRRVRLNGTW